jgi:hypothetical protein
MADEKRPEKRTRAQAPDLESDDDGEAHDRTRAMRESRRQWEQDQVRNSATQRRQRLEGGMVNAGAGPAEPSPPAPRFAHMETETDERLFPGHPCDGNKAALYRARGCDGRDDELTYEPIGDGQGFCASGMCLSRDSLRDLRDEATRAGVAQHNAPGGRIPKGIIELAIGSIGAFFYDYKQQDQAQLDREEQAHRARRAARQAEENRLQALRLQNPRYLADMAAQHQRELDMLAEMQAEFAEEGVPAQVMAGQGVGGGPPQPQGLLAPQNLLGAFNGAAGAAPGPVGAAQIRLAPLLLPAERALLERLLQLVEAYFDFAPRIRPPPLIVETMRGYILGPGYEPIPAWRPHPPTLDNGYYEDMRAFLAALGTFRREPGDDVPINRAHLQRMFDSILPNEARAAGMMTTIVVEEGRQDTVLWNYELIGQREDLRAFAVYTARTDVGLERGPLDPGERDLLIAIWMRAGDVWLGPNSVGLEPLGIAMRRYITSDRYPTIHYIDIPRVVDALRTFALPAGSPPAPWPAVRTMFHALMPDGQRVAEALADMTRNGATHTREEWIQIIADAQRDDTDAMMEDSGSEGPGADHMSIASGEDSGSEGPGADHMSIASGGSDYERDLAAYQNRPGGADAVLRFDPRLPTEDWREDTHAVFEELIDFVQDFLVRRHVPLFVPGLFLSMYYYVREHRFPVVHRFEATRQLRDTMEALHAWGEQHGLDMPDAVADMFAALTEDQNQVDVLIDLTGGAIDLQQALARMFLATQVFPGLPHGFVRANADVAPYVYEGRGAVNIAGEPIGDDGAFCLPLTRDQCATRPGCATLPPPPPPGPNYWPQRNALNDLTFTLGYDGDLPECDTVLNAASVKLSLLQHLGNAALRWW